MRARPGSPSGSTTDRGGSLARRRGATARAGTAPSPPRRRRDRARRATASSRRARPPRCRRRHARFVDTRATQAAGLLRVRTLPRSRVPPRDPAPSRGTRRRARRRTAGSCSQGTTRSRGGSARRTRRGPRGNRVRVVGNRRLVPEEARRVARRDPQLECSNREHRPDPEQDGPARQPTDRTSRYFSQLATSSHS